MDTARDRKACYQLTGSVSLSAALRCTQKTTAAGIQKKRSQLAAGVVHKGLLTTVELKLPTRWRTKTPKQFEGAKHTLCKKTSSRDVSLWGRKTGGKRWTICRY